MNEPTKFCEEIDADKALASSRKYVLVVSLIILGLLFSGAKVVEANTFILKLTFTNSEGILNLLLLSLIYLIIRYHSNASKYHDKVYQDWTNRLLVNESFYNICEHTDGESGYIVDISPEYAGYNDEHYKNDQNSHLSVRFIANWFFNSQFQYDLHSRDGHVQNSRVYLIQITKPSRSFKALWTVFKTWFDAQIRYRESLDIYAPYFVFLVTSSSAVFVKLF